MCGVSQCGEGLSASAEKSAQQRYAGAGLQRSESRPALAIPNLANTTGTRNTNTDCVDANAARLEKSEMRIALCDCRESIIIICHIGFLSWLNFVDFLFEDCESPNTTPPSVIAPAALETPTQTANRLLNCTIENVFLCIFTLVKLAVAA